jgi:hypothetical protein
MKQALDQRASRGEDETKRGRLTEEAEAEFLTPKANPPAGVEQETGAKNGAPETKSTGARYADQ